MQLCVFNLYIRMILANILLPKK
ncbi:hypothetical protein TRIP_B330302 [uncultured Desulfatiglans sp.]|uniref:Uncharacterized protein n=1 Tax=Uncultured Desulfatiglans sp. TaxID=1748965 RepID=A0A653A7Z8_UNCDX|nr:hypothetical protein TRIP_B330302 [uncultured Desulfatiglans sp.]